MQQNAYLKPRDPETLQEAVLKKTIALLQMFINRPVWVNGHKMFLEHSWDGVDVRISGSKEEGCELEQLSREEFFRGYLIPRVLEINDFFFSCASDFLTMNPILHDSPMHEQLKSLTKVSSTLPVPIIAVKPKPISRDGLQTDKPVTSFHEPIGGPDNGSIVWFVLSEDEGLSKVGVDPVEQLALFLAHELGHCLVRIHYKTNSYTDRRSIDGHLFNERMAWHVARDLLSKHCRNVDWDNFDKQSDYSLKQYELEFTKKNQPHRDLSDSFLYSE
jgi:hypothetical protein